MEWERSAGQPPLRGVFKVSVPSFAQDNRYLKCKGSRDSISGEWGGA